MKRLMHRTAVMASAFALTTGLAMGISAAPAFATDTACKDSAIAQPTPIHTWYTDTSDSEFKINKGTTVYGNCDYFNNTNEQRWYMAVWYEGTLGYIWVQRLSWGSQHKCFLTAENTWTVINANDYCPLQNVSPGS